MEQNIILKSISIFIFLWSISIVFLWFRPKIEFFWKIIATAILLLFFYFFKKEIMAGYAAFTADWYNALITFLREILLLLFYNLFIFWPLALIIIFYKADDIGAERLLKFMCVFTLMLCVVILGYVYYKEGVDRFIYEKLIDVIPFAK
ncbi:MAG: hypothetical protein JW982_03900 [Spirochaetes bacterium]|nr:hypothetical protein [Spirochaetota bacterium]